MLLFNRGLPQRATESKINIPHHSTARGLRWNNVKCWTSFFFTQRTKCYWSGEGQRSRIRRIKSNTSNIRLLSFYLSDLVWFSVFGFFFSFLLRTCSHLNVQHFGRRIRSCFFSSPWQQRNNSRVSGDAWFGGVGGWFSNTPFPSTFLHWRLTYQPTNLYHDRRSYWLIS